MHNQLPEWLRGYCLLGLAPGAFLPLSAAFLAVSGGIVLRSVYDIFDPLPLRDAREGSRLMLQWSCVLGIAVLLFFGLQSLAGNRLPSADKLGPLLRLSVGCCGGVLALRALMRLQISMFTPATAHTLSVDPANLILTETEMHSSHLALAETPHDVAPASETSFWRHSNIPTFLIGILLLGLAVVGWNTASLCLLRLPGGS